MDKPTFEKFKRYCISKNYGTDEYIKSLYDYLDERKWKKANGGELEKRYDQLLSILGCGMRQANVG